MFVKAAVFALFAQALLTQLALCQVCGRSEFAAAHSLGSTYGSAGPALTSTFGYNGLATGWSGSGLACNGPVYDAPAIEITPTTGGALSVTSISAPESSLVVASENMYEGTLAVVGELPFMGTVGLEGVVPSAGLGSVDHACGNGVTRMISQDRATVPSGFGTVLAPGNQYGGNCAFGNGGVGFGYGTGLAGLAYPNAGLVAAYPTNGFTGAHPGGAIGSVYSSALAPAIAYGGAITPGASYGGAGEGNVVVIGELPVVGDTAVAGQVPIMGAVRFSGNLPAAGAVTISGKCACGCSYPYI